MQFFEQSKIVFFITFVPVKVERLRISDESVEWPTEAAMWVDNFASDWVILTVLLQERQLPDFDLYFIGFRRRGIPCTLFLGLCKFLLGNF